MPTNVCYLVTWLMDSDRLVRQALRLSIHKLHDEYEIIHPFEMTREDFYKLPTSEHYRKYNGKIVEIEEIQNVETI